MLSIVIPAHNEEGSVGATISELNSTLKAEGIDHEIIVVDDNSTDSTNAIVTRLQATTSELKVVRNTPPNGFGLAVRKGLEAINGDSVAIFMADLSDSPQDLVRFYRHMSDTGVDCVFGTRFSKESEIVDYPRLKLVLNRFANWFIRILFGFKYNDVTNAFKLYGKNVISGVTPILSHHFNITVELPLKAIIRGYTYEVLPNSWYNRQAGESKLRIKEMGSRYMFIVLYCFLEKWLSKGDYQRASISDQSR